MPKVKYTGKTLLDHITGTWKPGETREMGESVAVSLCRERGDMVLLAEDTKPLKKVPAKAKEEPAGGEK